MTFRYLLPLILFLFAACSGSKQEREASDSRKEIKMTSEEKRISPNHCRVIATVVAISPTLKGVTDKDPCGKAPCIATVKIDSVLGYGSAFGSPIGEGQHLEVKFTHTLAATKTVAPELTPHLPGLSVGAKFLADIRSSIQMGSSVLQYSVDAYEKR